MNIKAVLIITILFASKCIAGEIQINNPNPVSGSQISVSYNHDGRFDLNHPVILNLLYFYGNNPEAKSEEYILKITPEKQTGTASFQLKDSVVYCILYVTGMYDDLTPIEDNNANQYWDILVYDKSAKALKGAYYRKAVTFMGTSIEGVGRRPDLRLAGNLIQSELESYPNNIIAEIAFASIQFEMRKLTASEFESELNRILKSGFVPANFEELTAIARAWRTINKNSKADAIEKDYLKNNRDNELYERLLIDSLSKAKSFVQFNNSCIDFLKDYPLSKQRERVYSALIDSYLQLELLDSLIEVLKNIGSTSIDAYSSIAVKLINNKKLYPKLKNPDRNRFIQNIVQEQAEPLLNSEKDSDLSIASPSASKKQQKLARDLFATYSTLGEIYLALGNDDKALDYFKRAYQFEPATKSTAFLESLTKLLLKRKFDDEVCSIIERSLSLSVFSNELIKIYKQSCNPNLILEANLNRRLDSIYSVATDKRRMIDYYTMLNLQLPNGFFKTLNGRIQEIEDLKNKVAVLSFWSTWCEPCRVQLADLEQVYNIFLDSNNVVAMALSVWEQSDDKEQRIADFLQKNKINLPVFYDPDDILPRQFGVNGLPTTVIIDKQGILQFILTGISSGGTFVDIVSDKIYVIENVSKFKSIAESRLRVNKK